MKRVAKKSPLIDVRNALRPFFNRRKPLSRFSQFQTIRKIAPESELAKIYSSLESNKAYLFPGLGNTFPTSGTAVPDSTLRQLEPLSLSREVIIQTWRLNHHADRLERALDELGVINSLIYSSKWSEAEIAIQAFRQNYGFSLIIAKKEMLVAFQRHGLAGLARHYAILTENADRRAWGLICNIMYNVVDPASSPSRTFKSWLATISSHSGQVSWYTSVVYWQIVAFTTSRKSLAEIILRYNATSLLDLLFVMRSMAETQPEIQELGRFLEVLDDRLKNSLSDKFSSRGIPRLPRYQDEEGGPSDTDLYRASFFFDEFSNVARWRAEMADMLFADGLPEGARSQSADSLLARSAEVIAEGGADAETSSGHMVQEWLSHVTLPGTTVTSTSFTKAIIAAEALRNLPENTSLTARDLIKLIGETPAIFESLETESLARLSARQIVLSDQTLSFLVKDMIFKRQRSQDNDLERRAAFMMIFIADGKEGIVPFLQSLSEWCRPAADYIAKVLSRVFLEKLYLIMTSVKDVIETRIQVLRWISEQKGASNEVLAEELSALERELANLDARSDIDSTRVHVDEEGLREWYTDTQNNSSVRYVQTVLAEGTDYPLESFLSFFNRVKETPSHKDDKNQDESGQDFILDTQVGSQFVLLEVVEKTLRAFVSDRSFGLDSYLSRRIRHGTLSGFLVTPISRVIQRLIEAEGADDQSSADLTSVREMVEGWRALLVTELDRARRELIQIRAADHPDGLIDPTWRVPSGVTYLDAMIARVRPRVIESKGAYDVFPDIHSLCWDLLERDLARVRVFLSREFHRSMAEELTAHYEALPFEQKIIAYPYVAEIQNALLSRVQEVCGWFIRPVFRRDKYDLATLVNSMVSITRELDVSYDFKDVVDIEPGLEINRGSFEVLSDVLFVLIGNAAKHGKVGGLISVTGVVEASEPSTLNLRVTSETETAESHAIALERIKRAFKVQSQSDLASASVEEGFTGIRKLVGLLTRLRPGTCNWSVLEDNEKREIDFVIRLPTKIAFKQERT